MSSLGENRTIRRWVCCDCHEAGISIYLGDCPSCRHSRCIYCDVKSHIATDAEVEEDLKIARVPAQSDSRAHGSRAQPGDGSQSRDMERQFFGTAVPPFRGDASEQVTPLAHLMNVALDSSPHQPGMYLCEIATGTQGHHIFVLRETQDAELISLWHKKLEYMSNECRSFCKSMVSMHLFRMGINEPTSTPTVLVNTSQPVDKSHKRMFQYAISDSLFSARPAVQIDFRQSRLRRSINQGSPNLPLPPICEPRNREFSPVPVTGSSIGISGSVEDTATLGCYLLVDGKPMVLTVDHLAPTSLRHNSTPSITHVSEQDHLEILGSAVRNLISKFTRSSTHICDACTNLRSPSLAYQTLLSRLTTLENSLWPISCPLYQDVKSKILTHQVNKCAALRLGERYSHSGRRFRNCTVGSSLEPLEIRREMDWALYMVFMDERLGCQDLQGYLLRYQISSLSENPSDRYLYPENIRPGALVRSLGRTSGHQVGQISNTMSIIFHEFHETQEWSVIRRPETGTVAWVEGGIGVDGDSGALIVDESTNAVYGMLWGRSGDGPATVTLFTPILEICQDIREIEIGRTKSISVLPCQEMPHPLRTDPGVSTQATMETVSITLRMDEDTSDQDTPEYLLEQSTPTPGIRRLSSIETGHPRPFERYRGHGTRRHSIPRGLERQGDEEKVDPEQFPGTYTYFRQVMAPEKE